MLGHHIYIIERADVIFGVDLVEARSGSVIKGLKLLKKNLQKCYFVYKKNVLRSNELKARERC
jgi:hypothetical protein